MVWKLVRWLLSSGPEKSLGRSWGWKDKMELVQRPCGWSEFGHRTLPTRHLAFITKSNKSKRGSINVLSRKIRGYQILEGTAKIVERGCFWEEPVGRSQPGDCCPSWWACYNCQACCAAISLVKRKVTSVLKNQKEGCKKKTYSGF